jgi:hypothetical protein
MGWFTGREKPPRRVVFDETLGRLSFYTVLPKDVARAEAIPYTANALATLYGLMTHNAAHLVPEVLTQAYELQCERPECVVIVQMSS